MPSPVRPNAGKSARISSQREKAISCPGCPGCPAEGAESPLAWQPCKSLTLPWPDCRIPCQEMCFSVIGAIPTVLPRFSKEFLRDLGVSCKNTGIPMISMDFLEIFGFLQVTIFGLKTHPRGSGARKQPQQSISKVGLHRVRQAWWPGHGLAASQMSAFPGPAQATQTPPPPS